MSTIENKSETTIPYYPPRMAIIELATETIIATSNSNDDDSPGIDSFTPPDPNIDLGKLWE